MNADQKSKPEPSSSENHPIDIEELILDVLTTIFPVLKTDEHIRKQLKAILRDSKVQIKQRVDTRVSKCLIPEISDLIESKFDVRLENQLMKFKQKGLETIFEEGRILRIEEIIQLARTSISELIDQRTFPNASKDTKKSLPEHNFNLDSLTSIFVDLYAKLKEGMKREVDRSVSSHFVPELSKLIESMCGNSPEKQLMALKPFITKGLETFLLKGRMLNKDEIIQQVKTIIPELIIQTTFPNASEGTKKSLKTVMETAINTALEKGLTEELITSTLSVALTEMLIPEASEREKKLLQNALIIVKVIIAFGLGATSSQNSVDSEMNKQGAPENIHNFEGFLAHLMTSLFPVLKTESIQKQLLAILRDLKVRVKQGVEQYVTTHLIPELSKLIESMCGYSPEKQLMAVTPFITKGLRIFLQEGRIFNKEEIIQQAIATISDLFVREASEKREKELVENVLNTVKEAVFDSGSTPSVEKLLLTIHEKCAAKVFCLARDKLEETINKLIENMPEFVDKIMEFLVRYVLPALSVCFDGIAFELVSVFLQESFGRIKKEGTVKGRNLAVPFFKIAAKPAINALTKKAVDNGIKEASKSVTEKVVTEKISHKMVEKCVVKRVGEQVVAKTTKKVATKASKSVVAKVTQGASSKAASTASQVTAKEGVKVSAKAVKSVSVQVSSEGAKVVGKVSQKASVKVTQKIGEGVAEVSKKATIKKTIKTTLTETAEEITTTTTKKVTQKSVTKTAENVSKTSSQAATDAGIKNAAKGGITAFGVSAVVGGVFLYRDLKELEEEKKKGNIDEKQYTEQKVERIGEYAGDVIGSGIVGAAVSIAALSGPAGWAAIGVGAVVSFATGKLGGLIAKSLVKQE